MLEAFLAVSFVVYSAFVWRLRGGAWANIGVHIGTNMTRFITGLLLAAPIAVLVGSWWLFLTLTVAITVGLMTAGWASYMGMGTHSRVNAMQWSDYPALLFKLKPETVTWDCLGMIITTIPMFTLIVLSFGIVQLTWIMALVGMAGAVLFTFSYWAVSRIGLSKLPTLEGTTGNGIIAGQVHEQWSEFVSGAVVGLTLLTLACIV